MTEKNLFVRKQASTAESMTSAMGAVPRQKTGMSKSHKSRFHFICFILLVALTGLNAFKANAQVDIIQFTWTATDTSSIEIAATNGQPFAIDWGLVDHPTQDIGTGAPVRYKPTPGLPLLGQQTVTIMANPNMTCRFTHLSCTGQYLTSLDVSKSTALTSLYCDYNSIDSLDVSNCTALDVLWCNNNSLYGLDVRNCTALNHLDCSNNSLSRLDVSDNTALTVLECANNPLSTLNISKNTALNHLWCGHNSLSVLDVSKNTALATLWCSENSLSALDVSKNTELGQLHCDHNSLSVLDVSKNTALRELACHYNSLSNLDVSKNTALDKLYCYNNSLYGLDVSKDTGLTSLCCYDNSILLSDLFVASEILKGNGGNISERQLGNQTLRALNAIKGITLFSDQSVFGGKYTQYEVIQNGDPANPSDYTVTDGKITFHTVGTYTVTMTNEVIISNASYPARVSIELTVKDLLKAHSVISGYVGQDSSNQKSLSQKSVDNPAEDIDVYLQKDQSINDWITVAQTLTDAEGYFEFKDVAAGRYKVMLDVPGLTLTNPQILDIGDNDTITNIVYEITGDSIVNKSGGDDVGIEQLTMDNGQLTVYPNPTNYELRIKNYETGFGASQLKEGDVIEIYNVVGQKVGAYPCGRLETTINVQHLPNGMYYIKVNERVSKFVKMSF